MLGWLKSRKQRKLQEVPNSVRIEGGPFEELVRTTLAAIAEEAAKHESGETFTFIIDMPEGVHYMHLVGPIMMRSSEAGVMPGSCFNGTFEFTKL